MHFDQLVQFPEKYEPWERIMIQKEKLIETLEYCEKILSKMKLFTVWVRGVLQEIVYDVLRGYTNSEYEENEFFKHSSTLEVLFL